MRIDFSSNGLPQTESTAGAEANATAGKPASAAEASSTAEAGSSAADRANFSFDSARVESLTAQALAAPEVRQAKVASLSQAIGGGAYQVDAAKIAGAMAAEWSGGDFR